MVESDGVSTLSLSKGGDFNYQHSHDDPISVEDSGRVPINSQRGNDNPMGVEDSGRYVPHSGSIPLDLNVLGLTLTDTTGNLPDLGTDKTCICQFNFSDFDAAHDASAPNSIELLRW
ncbi:hypothetical protein RJ640_011799 [Escallonia rubra]|uniref:Uncharacterized protein n=1 Tax=Escallonia rubra TaxID=112253 RepID=A0AA88QPZ1_9ASTE|nr:hypothetical protein RJ640_011799 [Escallonia rubra]